jgi:hypothetical protein
MIFVQLIHAQRRPTSITIVGEVLPASIQRLPKIEQDLEMTTEAVVLAHVKMKPSKMDTRFIDLPFLISSYDLEDGKRLAGTSNI